MKLIEADKVKQAIKYYWKAQVDKALTLTDGNEKRINSYLEHNHELLKAVDELPSVQPERKTGHWVEIGDEPYDEWECDVCGFVIDGSGCIDPEEYRDVYKFCPNCGADMRPTERRTDG